MQTNPPTELGRLIDESDWSRRRLAVKMGIHRTSLGRWALGLEAVPRRRQAQLAVHLEAPVSQFIDENGFARPNSKEIPQWLT